MHWCVNINTLQRPFPLTFFSSWLLPSPEESVSSVKYHFLLFRPEIPGRGCCLAADSSKGRKEDVERVWIEYDFTFHLPPYSLTHTRSFLIPRYCIEPPATICIRCAIEPLYVSYLHRDRWWWGGGGHFGSDPGPVRGFPWLFGDVCLCVGSSTWLQPEDGCSAVLQKQTGISSREENGSARCSG